MLTSNSQVVGRYDSLEALFSDLARQLTSVTPYGGCVRVHPNMLPEKGLRDYIAARQRADEFGLRLVITPAVSPNGVELRSYLPPRDE